ncbi:MAG TPA: conjugative transfer protein MobI(A/C) [Rhodanobacter sp.]|nr:conjugative transfer protein MobI(A/C) [Rhodanobacter sp.]
MDPTERSRKISELKLIVTSVRSSLEDYADVMWHLQDEFQAERRAILAAVKRQQGRSQTSNLLLCIRSRSDRTLGAPTADWKCIKARGHRVVRAKTTMAGKRRWRIRPADGSASKVNIFSNTIPKNRKFGWRTADLRRYAHPCEFDLVVTTEARLEPLRKQVAALTLTGTRALQSLYQHERALRADAGNVCSARPASPTSVVKGTPESCTSTQKADPPQLRKPRQNPTPIWPASYEIVQGPDESAVAPHAPPQFRRPL